MGAGALRGREAVILAALLVLGHFGSLLPGRLGLRSWLRHFRGEPSQHAVSSLASTLRHPLVLHLHPLHGHPHPDHAHPRHRHPRHPRHAAHAGHGHSGVHHGRAQVGEEAACRAEHGRGGAGVGVGSAVGHEALRRQHAARGHLAWHHHLLLGEASGHHPAHLHLGLGVARRAAQQGLLLLLLLLEIQELLLQLLAHKLLVRLVPRTRRGHQHHLRHGHRLALRVLLLLRSDDLLGPLAPQEAGPGATVLGRRGAAVAAARPVPLDRPLHPTAVHDQNFSEGQALDGLLCLLPGGESREAKAPGTAGILRLHQRQRHHSAVS
mmetsp:Transcript_30990/g.70539  ORF Transcript_30990/g.70539 Transcript_30990/m.70539 type:complete len:323 (+) Transcript_30990:961-1929(+)